MRQQFIQFIAYGFLPSECWTDATAPHSLCSQGYSQSVSRPILSSTTSKTLQKQLVSFWSLITSCWRSASSSSANAQGVLPPESTGTLAASSSAYLVHCRIKASPTFFQSILSSASCGLVRPSDSHCPLLSILSLGTHSVTLGDGQLPSFCITLSSV